MSMSPMVILSMLALSNCGLAAASFQIIATSRRRRIPATTLYADNNRWWDGVGTEAASKLFGGGSGSSANNGEGQERYQQNLGADDGKPNEQRSLITRDMEDEVMASARAAMDSSTVSRAMSSLIDENSAGVSPSSPSNKSDVQNHNRLLDARGGNNSLRDLASTSAVVDGRVQRSVGEEDQIISSSGNDNNSWDVQQIAIASGATTCLLSPIIVPVIHGLLPPIIPFPSSVSFTGAALLGTIAYIVALGDPTVQSMGDGAEVGGAVSRIVGRTALKSARASAPRLKAAARAMVDYDDGATATIEELRGAQRQLSQTVLELEEENGSLRNEVALWRAVEDVSGMYKLEELKEMARYEGLRGYSTDGKNALLRRLVREGILKLDLTPYY